MEPLLRDTIICKVQQLRSLADMEIKDRNLCIAIAQQDTIGWHNFLLRHTTGQFEQLQQDSISVTYQWNSSCGKVRQTYPTPLGRHNEGVEKTLHGPLFTP
jgi:hypothetical protein